MLDAELASGRLVIPLAGPRIDARGYGWTAWREVANAPLVEQFCRWIEAQAMETEEDKTQEMVRGKTHAA